MSETNSGYFKNNKKKKHLSAEKTRFHQGILPRKNSNNKSKLRKTSLYNKEKMN